MSGIDPATGRKTATDKRDHIRHTTDYFTNQPKLDALIDDPERKLAAIGVHGASMGISRRHGGDGHVDPDEVIATLGISPELGKLLIAAGMWHQPDHNCLRCPQPRQGHIYIHDYLEHNRSAAQETELSQKRRAAAAASHDVRWNNRPPRAAEFDKPKRGPGRPRKNPPAEQEPQTELADVLAFPSRGTQVLDHPAETRARQTTKRKARQPVEASQYQPIVHELCSELAAVVEGNGFSVGKIGPAWWKPCEQLLRIGPPRAKKGLTPEQIRKAINWANSDNFWWKNIRSMENLREHYERLRADAQDPARAKRGSAGAVRRAGPSGPPPAIVVPGMNSLYSPTTGATSGMGVGTP